MLPNNCCVLLGSFFLPFTISIISQSLWPSSSPVETFMVPLLLTLIVSVFQNCLKMLAFSSARAKNAHFMLSLKGNAGINAKLKTVIHCNALSTVEAGAYHGLTFSSYAKWTTTFVGFLRKNFCHSIFEKNI